LNKGYYPVLSVEYLPKQTLHKTPKDTKKFQFD